MHFNAPWGTLLRITSLLVTVVLGGVVVIGLAIVSPDPPWLRLVMVSGPLLLLAGCALFVVRGYTIEGGHLLIHRLCWDTSVSLEGLKDAAADPAAMKGAIRLFGNGGAFSFSGVFWSRRLGRFRAFVTDFNRLVVLHLRDRTLVVSPADPERFVEAVTQLTAR